MASSAAGCVVIVGSGVIGRSWAMLFASGGFQVKLYDIEQQQIRNALENIRKEMKLLEQAGSLKGSLSVEEQLSLISGCPNIQEAVEGAMHIQLRIWKQTEKAVCVLWSVAALRFGSNTEDG
uniref:Crystallin lambda 1 n=1 Tax=Pongo abelii TaxID=9601 RepID=A0A8I5UK36_PONAB